MKSRGTTRPPVVTRSRRLLQGCIERVVEERGPRQRILIIFRDEGKTAGDGAQAGGDGLGLWCVANVGAMHDAGERQQRRIACAVLVDQRLERAAAFRVLVRVGRFGRVETLRPGFLLHARDLLRLDEEELRLRIDEPADEPRRGGAVDPDALARDPFHRWMPSKRCKKSPTTPAEMIRIGSGIFLAFTRSTSVTAPMAMVGMSMKARLPRTTAAPAMAPAAAAVTPATNALTRSFFDQRRTLGASAITTA